MFVKIHEDDWQQHDLARLSERCERIKLIRPRYKSARVLVAGLEKISRKGKIRC